MKRRLSAVEARKKLGEVLDGVYYRGDEVVIERAGKPLAVVVPIFPGPLRWMGVADTGAGVSQLRFWLGRSDRAPVSIVPATGPSPAPSLEALPAVRAFRAVARVPIGSVRAEGTGSVVEYRDWAFEDHPGGGPLALRLRLDASGAVRQIEIGHRF